jgi:glycosyltransferase involved in cell wall biosynthesis
MVAFHYPPCRGSSGLQRTLNFTRHLPKHGWDPALLSIHPRAYPETSADQMPDVPPEMPLERAYAFDAARHLSIKGRHFSASALPDRWISWYLWGVPAGMRMIKKFRPAAIWSTYPIATSLWIGYALHRKSGLPWIVDIRDPLTEDDPRTGERHPQNPKLWSARRKIEEHSILQCSRVVLVTPGARKIYVDRYGSLPSNHWALIPNGYAEESFAEVEKNLNVPTRNGQPLHLLHSGILYPTPDRDPSAFFAALGKLREQGRISPQKLRITLRASGYDDRYRVQIQKQKLDDIVTLAPSVPYREALAEMMTADGLLVFQGYTSNPAVPAKLYEYLRAKRPIFAMVDSQGDTAATIRSAKTGIIVPLESSEEISQGLLKFLSDVDQGLAPVADETVVRSFARESRARDLATLLDEVVEEFDKSRKQAS